MENGQSFEWQQANTYLPMSFDWYASYTLHTTSTDTISRVLVLRRKYKDGLMI